MTIKKITLSADETDTKLAEEFARSQKTTLDELVREWLKDVAGRQARANEYRALMERLRYVDAGRTFTREEMNERR